jgi:hypothetical protein
MRGKLDVRALDDIGDLALSFAEVRALATGNPLLLEKATADSEYQRLQRAARAHARTQTDLDATIERCEKEIAGLEVLAEQIDRAVARRDAAAAAAGGGFLMTVNGETHDTRHAAAEALRAHLLDELEQWRRRLYNGERHGLYGLGELSGFGLAGEMYHSPKRMVLLIEVGLADVPRGTVSLTASELFHSDLVSRLEHLLTRLDGARVNCETDIARCRSEINHARENLGASFPQSARLEEARQRAREISEQLDAMGKDSEREASAKVQAEAEEAAAAKAAEQAARRAANRRPVVVPDDVRAALAGAITKGVKLILPEELPRALYVRVSTVLEAAGGLWDTKAAAHLFDEPAAGVLAALLGGCTASSN